MSDDEVNVFDPNFTKKKKKKKKPFVPDDIASEPLEVQEEVLVIPEPLAVSDKQEDDESRVKKDISDDLDDLDLSLKKKKKKKKPFDLSELDSALPVEEPPALTTVTIVPEDSSNLVPVEDEREGSDEFDFSLKKKKKGKKKNREEQNGEEAYDPGVDEDKSKDEDVSFTNAGGGLSWAGSERDYTYDELLSRVFNIMREKNPEMMAGEKRKFVMKPPQVVRVGTKKSSFANFADICKLLHRQPKHLLAFLLAELGTSGSIDGNNQLIIKGRFQQKQIESVLRRYIKEYVTCHTCRSPDTTLQKDTRLYFLQCETCHSRCSVASIKTGFQAVTGKRAQMRAKAH
uniref:Eukaryotic translation initiation factor 2 subunit 2 n=1 Tax=Eptatretus burgeri TaxID=7764 RepID=A0A8C4QZW5_EPTBU